MKMRSSSTFTFGNRACKSRARFQCVVARQAVEQTCFGQDNKGAGAGRGDPSASLKGLAQEFDQARRRRFGATAEKQRIENRGAERLCHDADADRAAHEAAGLGQQMQIVDRLAHLLVRVFEDGERSEATHLKAGADDKTDTLHARLCASVRKRRLNDL